MSGHTKQSWHIRYSVKTSSLFQNNSNPTQHAVDNATIKTLCGRNASELWALDKDCNVEKNVTCSRCKTALANATEKSNG